MITIMIAINRLHNVAQIKESDWYKRMVTLRVVDRSNNNNSPLFIFIYMCHVGNVQNWNNVDQAFAKEVEVEASGLRRAGSVLALPGFIELKPIRRKKWHVTADRSFLDRRPNATKTPLRTPNGKKHPSNISPLIHFFFKWNWLQFLNSVDKVTF